MAAHTARGQPVTLDPLADSKAALRPDTVKLSAEGAPEGVKVTAGGAAATDPGHGDYRVEPGSGKITFTPADGFVGNVSMSYTVSDQNGDAYRGVLDVTVDPPDFSVPDLAESVDQGSSVSFRPLTEQGATLDQPRIELLDDQANPSATTSGPAGRFTVTDDVVTFTAADGYVGTARVDYRVVDRHGVVDSSSIEVTVTAVTPTAVDHSASTRQGSGVDLNLLADAQAGNDAASLRPDSLRLAADGLPPGSALSPDGQQLTIPGQGRFTIRDGHVSFTPERAFHGDTTPVRYTIENSQGNTASASFIIRVSPVDPQAGNDEGSGNPGRTIAVSVLGNDDQGDTTVPLDASSVLLEPGASNGFVSDGGKTLTVPGEGTYHVGSDGVVTFSPAHSFSGAATAIGYSVADENGTRVSAALNLTVQGRALEPLDRADSDGTGLTAQSGVSHDAYFLNADGEPTDRLILPQGIYQVDTTGKVTFTPAEHFHGKAPAVTLFGKDDAGNPISQMLDLSAASSAEKTAAPAPSADSSARAEPGHDAATTWQLPLVPSIVLGAALLGAIVVLILVVRRRAD